MLDFKRIGIVANPKSGKSETSQSEIRKVFAGSGKELVFIDITKGPEDAQKRAAKKNVDVLVAAGGDGTVNFVANLAVAMDVPMAVLPCGTLNHFAKDMKLPLDMHEAARAILQGKLKTIDYCTVNDRVFVNNSGIGIYPKLVDVRDEAGEKVGKVPATVYGIANTSVRSAAQQLTFTSKRFKKRFKTPMVFVGNNSYAYSEVGLTNRKTLRGGVLFLYAARTSSALRLLKLAVAGIFGKHIKGQNYIYEGPESITITSDKKKLKVSFDGEVATLHTPLHYEIHPKGLEVIA